MSVYVVKELMLVALRSQVNESFMNLVSRKNTCSLRERLLNL